MTELLLPGYKAKNVDGFSMLFVHLLIYILLIWVSAAVILWAFVGLFGYGMFAWTKALQIAIIGWTVWVVFSAIISKFRR